MTYARCCITHLQAKLSYQTFDIFKEPDFLVNQKNETIATIKGKYSCNQ